MTGHIKNSGTWRTISSPKVKVAGTWRNVSAAWVKVAGTWRQWFISLITDNFNRTTSGSLGTSSSGFPWSAIRGVWFANGSAAQTNDAASTYPIAVVNAGSSDVTLSATDISNGAGLALWVTDSGNWWAVSHQREDSTYSYSCNCQTCTGYTCDAYSTYYYSCNCSTCSRQTCISYSTYSYSCNCDTCSATGCNQWYEYYYACNCSTCYAYLCDDCQYGDEFYPCNCGVKGYSCNCATCYSNQCTSQYTYYYSCNCSTCQGTTCSGGYTTTYYDCNCSTCQGTQCTSSSPYYYSCNCQSCSGTTNNYFLRLLRSVTGTVSLIKQAALGTTQPTAMKVVANGLNITATSYTDSGLTTVVGSPLTHTATSGTANQQGVVLTPSPAGQGTTLDNFSATSP